MPFFTAFLCTLASWFPVQTEAFLKVEYHFTIDSLACASSSTGPGKKIFDKINEKMNPQFEDEKPMNPFDLWAGANFKLKIRKVEGYRNYDKSEFEDSSPLSDDDADMEAIWKSQYSLAELIAPDKFKSYDELKKRLDKVLAEPSSRKNEEDDDVPFERPVSRPAAAPAVGKTASAPKKPVVDDDDDLEFFKKLAEDDE